MKTSKLILALCLVATILFSFAACGSKVDNPDTEVKETTPAEETKEEEKAFEPVSGTYEDFNITVVGAEAFKDHDDKDALRVYYDFTNNSDEPACAGSEVEFLISQDGYSSESTYASAADDVDEYGNASLYILPGVTIRCIEEVVFKADGGSVEVKVTNLWEDEDVLTVELDSQNLPAPADKFEITPITDPTWAKDFPIEGNLGEDGYVKVLENEFTENYDGDKLLRVFFEFTNTTEEPTNFFVESYLYAYQDGVQLEVGYAEEETAEDDAFDTDIEPDATVKASRCFKLRSESPVEIEVYDFMDEIPVGAIISLG
ncbi:MAG: DUF5067 domain-containing protein [Clostridia bacterium]|nr:DUF5067 domain-containing protein [Clostridia bacterium]